MSESVSLLFVGDVVGEQAVEFVGEALPGLLERYAIDFCVLNGENAHQGRGLNEVIVKRFYRAGANVITGGDHSFDKHLIFPYMGKDRHLLRPMNYPKGVPGFGYGVYPIESITDEEGLPLKIGVINLRGQTFFNNPIQCPFRTADWVIAEIQKETRLIFVDFHAEASAEKIALAHYLDGRVSAVVGTHTHVQTADERILPGGTAFLTDVGCTGVYESVIGMNTESAISRFLLQTPHKYELAEGPIQLSAVQLQIETATGRALSLERISLMQKQVYKPESTA